MTFVAALVVVQSAIPQLAVVQVGFFGPLVGQLLDSGHVLAFPLALGDSFEQGIGHRRMLVQVIIQFPFDKIPDKGAERSTTRGHVLGSQLGFGLRLKNRLLNPQANSTNDGAPDIGGIKILFVKFPNGPHQRLAVSRQMRTPLGRVLTVHEGIIFLAVLFTVGKGQFNIVSFEVNDRIANRIRRGLAHQKIQQAVLRKKLLAVEVKTQPRIEVSVIPQLFLNEFVDKMKIPKNLSIRNKVNQGSVLLVGR